MTRAIRLLHLSCVCALLLVSLRPAQAAQALALVTEDEYWQLVEVTYQTVISLEGQPEGSAYQALLPLSNQWAEINQVAMPKGRTVSVNHSYIVSLMRSSPPKTAFLRDQLTALRAERSAAASFTGFNAADAQTVRRILNRSEFQWESGETNPLLKNLASLWARFTRWLNNLFAHTGLGSVSTYVFGALGAIVLLVVVIFVLRHALGDFVAEAQSRSRDGNEENLTADTALMNAQKLSSAGDYRSAVRYLYLSALLVLEERGLLRYDRTKTNREYLRSLANLPELATNLRQVVEVFDQVWYGFQPLDEVGYSKYARLVKDLQKK
jgi:hypothetical protein